MVGQRRRTLWARWRTGAGSLAALGVAKVSLRSLIVADRPGLAEYTITRTIGNIWIRATSAVTTADVVAGIITLPGTVTVTDAPEPFTEPHADWMYYKATTIPLSGDSPNNQQMEFDLASQRRQRDFERDWALILVNRGTVAITFSVGGSSLLKL